MARPIYHCLSLLLTVLLLTVAAQSQFHSCKGLVEQWIEDPQRLPPLVFANSGKFLNDLGDYNNCKHNSENYVYFTLSVFSRVTMLNQFMGLCAPIECRDYLNSNDDIENLQNILNQAYQNATNTTFIAFADMKLYDPDQTKPQMDWSNYMAIGFLSLLTLFGILGSVVSKVAPQSKALPMKVLKSFSFYDNFMKIIVVPKVVDNENLLFLNGMRVLSIFWIVLGHDLWFRFMNMRNWMDSINILSTPGITTIGPAAYFAVDVFFWIGGFLMTMGMLDQMKKRIKFIPFYFGCIVHRIIRIWPTYMVAILMFWKIAPYFGDGPIWNTLYQMTSECNNGGVVWNMFFVDNFGDHGPNGRKYCFAWGWYLAVDFQLFLITPFILFAYRKSKKIGLILTFLLFLGAVITAFVMIYVNEWRYPIIKPKLKPQPTFMDDFYYKPYVRSSAYFIGILSGFIYHEWKNQNQKIVGIIDKIKNSILIRTLFYIFGIGLTQFVIWIIVPFQQGDDWSNLRQALYNSLNRVIYLIGVYMLVFAAMFGCKNDPVKFILGHSFFSPLAKISFAIYLTHFIMIMRGAFSSRIDFYWQSMSSIYIVITDIFYSIILALILSLLVESPTLGLEKIFLRGGGDKKKGQQISKKDIETLEKSYIQIQEGQEIKQRLMKDFQQYSQKTNTSSQPAKRNVQSLL